MLYIRHAYAEHEVCIGRAEGKHRICRGWTYGLSHLNQMQGMHMACKQRTHLHSFIARTFRY